MCDSLCLHAFALAWVRAVLPACRPLDERLGLTEMAVVELRGLRRAKNTQHSMLGPIRSGGIRPCADKPVW